MILLLIDVATARRCLGCRELQLRQSNPDLQRVSLHGPERRITEIIGKHKAELMN